MAIVEDHTCLPDLALLYLGVSHSPDDIPTGSEVESLIHRLANLVTSSDRSETKTHVKQVLEDYRNVSDMDQTTLRAAARLREKLSATQKKAVLEELSGITVGDELSRSRKKSVVDRVLEVWAQSPMPTITTSPMAPPTEWGVLHDLAYIFLVLAHGTDDDLTESEVQVMTNKLQEWRPQDARADMRSILEAASDAYAEGTDEKRLKDAIDTVRDMLPREQRMAAMNDLVKIANADGVFLDDEEDLINYLMSAWNVDPYANYGAHGSKE